MKSTPPPPLMKLADTGLGDRFLLTLLIKNMLRFGYDKPMAMATALCLPVPIVEEIISVGREAKLLQTLGALGASMSAELRYELTDAGRAWGNDALRQSEYTGPAPVPLEQFADQVARQSIRNETIGRQALEHVLKGLIISDTISDAVGPAANSASSMLFYGPPGNGKSSIANAICAAFQDVIYVPHAIEIDRQVITVFDGTVHRAVDEEAGGGGLRAAGGHDKRFQVCKRPVVVTGGELTINMLDLSYNPVSRIYEAPLQMKAAGGVFVIDDFGRQREQPQALINRWIIPLEQGTDFLMLQTGRKFEAPFDTLVIFSTNIPPKQLVDDAALRRIRHKIEIGRPTQDMFIRIFYEACKRRKIALTEDILTFLLTDLYAVENAPFAAFQAEFLLDQVTSICAYEGIEPQLTEDFLKRAWRNLFTTA
ncbi:MAG: ATPase [Pikeienuella sp.]